MSNLLAIRVINRNYVNNSKKLVDDIKNFFNYESRKDEDDLDWKDDACVMYHDEILQYKNIRIGALQEIFTESELTEYGLQNVDSSEWLLCIETDNDKYILISEDNTIHSLFANILYSDKNIVYLFQDKYATDLVAIPLSILKGVETDEIEDILNRLYEYNV